MTDGKADARLIAERVIGVEAEIEAAGNALFDDQQIQAVHATLHEWIDGVIGAVASPALGRVTLIHKNGRTSSISSPELSFALNSNAR